MVIVLFATQSVEKTVYLISATSREGGDMICLTHVGILCATWKEKNCSYFLESKCFAEFMLLHCRVEGFVCIPWFLKTIYSHTVQ